MYWNCFTYIINEDAEVEQTIVYIMLVWIGSKGHD
jgi:hypothetical protein